MTLFIDASALVAIIAGEPERRPFVERIVEDGKALWSPMSCWETVSSLRNSHDYSMAVARTETDRAAADLGLRLVAIGGEELHIALDAYQTYGRRAGSRANLNFGDCFAYACAKAHGAELLYKGDDFARTDLA